jgi:tetratricopeptide (TPR) repeat protein
LLRIDQRVGEVLKQQVGRDELAAIVREAVQSALPSPGDAPRPPEELPAALVEWAKRRGLTLDAVRQEVDAWEQDLERAANGDQAAAAGEQALAAYARRELGRAAELAASQAAAAEEELADAEKHLAELAEKRRASRRQAWENRTLQARALYDQWRFAEAFEAYRSAVVHVAKDTEAEQWAATQNNLGTALSQRGVRTGGEAGAVLLAEAVAAYRSVLEVFTLEVASHYNSLLERNLDRALKRLAEHLSENRD